jgi:hypothetical protein
VRVIRIDDLHVGQYVTVTGFRKYLGADDGPPKVPDILGAPMKIVAVSHPFVAVEFVGGNVTSLDTRAFCWALASRGYVKFWQGQAARNRQAAEKLNEARVDTRPKCDWCGDRLAQRRKETGKWVMYCRRCNEDKTT